MIRHSAVALVAFGVASWSLGQEKLPAVVEKYVSATRTARFSGKRSVEILRSGQRLEGEELFIQDGSRVRVQMLEGQGKIAQLFIEADGIRYAYLPKKNEVHTSPAMLNRTAIALTRRGDKGKLTLSVDPSDTIAGRKTYLVTVTNPRNFVVMKLWIDPKSGIELKHQQFDLEGNYVGGFQFTEIDLNPQIDPQMFDTTFGGAKVFTRLDILRRMAKETGFDFIVLRDRKFNLQNSKIIRAPRFGPILSHTYSGPGGQISIYQSRGPLDAPKLRRFTEGYNVYVLNRGNQSIALVGNQNNETLQEIARNLYND